MKMIITIFTLLQFAYFGYAADQTRESQIDDIREAVFRYQFAHVRTNEQDAKVYVLGVGESCSNPTDEFLKRFAGHQPPVKKASESDWIPDKGRVDKETAGKVLVFCASSIAWISDTDVEVSGTQYSAMLAAGGDYFTVKREDGKWKVTEVNNKWKRRVLTH